MDFVKGANLFDRIKTNGRMKEKTFAKVFQQMVSAISFFHKINIAHMDVKLENFIFQSSRPSSPNYLKLKLVDFGRAKPVDFVDPSRNTINHYTRVNFLTPPETVIDNTYSIEGDVWALGICAFMMVFGQMLFFADNDPLMKKTKARIRKGFDPVVRTTQSSGILNHFPA